MWRQFRLELSAAILVLLSAWAWTSGRLLSGAVLGLGAIVLTGIVAVRWGRVVLHRVIWHLRDRLIVAYLFIAVIPIAVIVLAARWVVVDVGGQVAVYLVSTELKRTVEELAETARTLAQAPAARREVVLDQIASLYAERLPGLQAHVSEGPTDLGPAGVVAQQGRLYLRARAAHNQQIVTLQAPITRRTLSRLAPGLGPVSIIALDADQELALHDDGSQAPALPAKRNRFDLELRWASQMTVPNLDDPGRPREALLGVRSRVATLLETIFAGGTGEQADLRNDMRLAVILLLLAQAVSVYIGVSVTRAITEAFTGLYVGTQRIMRGDFSHRIAVKGDDQIAEVTTSFNQMTGNLERLLEVAKEKERFEAELAIARQVQEQLFPRSVPEIPGVELRAVCHPARMVSGDYYDYQPLGGTKTMLVLGDVAGKGVSAALLMASLQACIRRQVSDLRAMPERVVSPSQLVADINRQLYASTSPEKFATFFLAIYDHATSELAYTNAGHLPPILVRGGKAEFLQVNGMVIGAFPGAKYEESRLKLEPGDLLFGYTDGVTEPENEFDEMFGEERMTAVLLKETGHDATALFNAMAAAVHQFTGSAELQDDMTMVLVRRCPA